MGLGLISSQLLRTLLEFLEGKEYPMWNHSDFFAEVPKFPVVEKWLLNEEDAPSDAVLWS